MKHIYSRGFILGIFVLMVGCGQIVNKKSEFTVLIRMMPAYKRFFFNEIIKPFEKQNKCKINIKEFDNQWDIERILKLEAGKEKSYIGLVKTPFDMTKTLVLRGYMKKLNEIKDSLQTAIDITEYHPFAVNMGYINGNIYYLPVRFETGIIFYRKSKVADAVIKIDIHKERINDELKGYNGYGLPTGYILENDPNQWNFYDLYAIGSIWAHEKYNNTTTGRIAHNGASYSSNALFFIDRIIQLGGSENDILRFTTDKNTIAEMFLWENMLIRCGAYNPGMWQDSWKTSDIYNRIKEEEVFLAYMNQIDCFTVHGVKDNPEMPTYLPEISDMEIAIVPEAVSFELDTLGTPLYKGSRDVSIGGHLWGIPKNCPNAKLAYDLARFITSKENQLKECLKFGMLPVRNDVLNSLPQLSSEGNIASKILDVSIRQIKMQLEKESPLTIPLVKQYTQIGQNYIEAWYKLCVKYNEKEEGLMNLSTMKMRLGSDFLEKQHKILGNDYPEL